MESVGNLYETVASIFVPVCLFCLTWRISQFYRYLFTCYHFYFLFVFGRNKKGKYPKKYLWSDDPQLEDLSLQVTTIISSNTQPLHVLSTLKYVEGKVGPEE